MDSPIMTERTQRGFTLIELMVVVTIAAVLLGLGIPSFREFMAGQQVKNTAFDFAASLLLARSEAVKRNGAVSVIHGGAAWSEGWTVDAGGATLSTKEAVPGVAITANPDPTASVAYAGTGRIASTLRFEFTAPNTTAVRCVSISSSGVPNTTTGSCPP